MAVQLSSGNPCIVSYIVIIEVSIFQNNSLITSGVNSFSLSRIANLSTTNISASLGLWKALCFPNLMDK